MNTFLTLTRPLVFFDLETTGADISTDQIVEISVCKLLPDGSKEIKTRRFKPSIPISPDATAVHGITDDDVKDENPFIKYAKSLNACFQDCDVAGYNCIRFDVPILVEEFLRSGVGSPFNKNTRFLDAMRIFHEMEKRDLSAALKFYCNKELQNAHSAEADVLATAEVLEMQLKRYNLPKDLDALHKFCNNGTETIDYARKFIRNSEGQIVFNFGQYKNQPALSQPDYLNWMLSGDFSLHTRQCIIQMIDGSLK